MTDDNYDPDDPDNFADVDTMAGKEDEKPELADEDIEEIDDESDEEAV